MRLMETNHGHHRSATAYERRPEQIMVSVTGETMKVSMAYAELQLQGWRTVDQNSRMNLTSSNSFQAFQSAVVPGIEGLHRSMRAIFDVVLQDEASVLVVGAGGGRELETLGASPRSYRMVGVDPSPEMLALAQLSVRNHGLMQRTTLHEGLLDDLPPAELFDAATSFFVMHFLRDDGAKRHFLETVRKRLPEGAPYLHIDVCFDSLDSFERLRPVYAAHAELNGLDPQKASEVSTRVGTMPVISEEALEQRFRETGFGVVAPFFRGLWYTGWWLETI